MAESSVLAFEFCHDESLCAMAQAEVWETFTVGTPHTRSHHLWGCMKDEPAVHLGDVLDLVLEETLGCVMHWRHGQAVS